MKFVTNINLKDYECFMQENKDSAHFLQSIEWAKASERDNLIPHFVGVRKDDKLVATAMLLQRTLPLKYSYFYIPKGFTMNYHDKEVLKFFTEEIMKYTKKLGSIYTKIDPDVELHKINSQGEVIEGENNYQLVRYMQELGYIHLGYNKFFEHSNPRYTFRINVTDPIDVITNRFHQSSKQRIKKAEAFGVKVYVGNEDDIKKFYQLMEKTEKKKNFFSHDLAFYQKFYKIFKEHDHVTLYIAEINIDEALKRINESINNLQEELKSGENLSKNQKQTLNCQIDGFHKSYDEFAEIKKSIGNNIVLSSYMIVNYGVKCWTLYSCNEPAVKAAFGNYLIYNTQVIDAHNKGFKIFDAFGTIGDLNADGHLTGLHEFKKKFGGEYIEFIGEFDYPQRKLLYYVFTKLVPIYRKITNKRLKKKIQ